jgi:NADPH-dependent ferric siderophore reductase
MGYYSDYYRADVREVVALTPNMIRIVFGGEDLRRFVTSGDPDERLVVVLPRPGERETPAPVRPPVRRRQARDGDRLRPTRRRGRGDLGDPGAGR